MVVHSFSTEQLVDVRNTEEHETETVKNMETLTALQNK